MLLKTTLELKTYFSSIDKEFNFQSLKSFVLDAELDLIIPEISQEQYDKVRAAYDAGTLAGKLLQLHTLLQKAITHLALLLNADSGSFRISDAGYYVSVSADAKPVSDKKMLEFKKGRAESGYRALDQALVLMEQNINDPAFAEYKDSELRKAAGGYFISGPIAFTRCFSALKNSGTTFRAILSAMDQAEQEYILPILGEDLFLDLKSKQLAGTLSEDEKSLISKIQKPLAYLSITEAIPMTGFEFDGKTFSVNALATNNDNIEVKSPLSDQRLSSLMNACKMTGDKELARLKTYLVSKANLFPLFPQPDDTDFTGDPNDSSHGFFYV